MKKQLILSALLLSGMTLFAAFSMRDPAALHLMSPKPATGGLLAEYVADTAYFNSDWADAGVTSWAPAAGSIAGTLTFNADISSGPPNYLVASYDGKPCVSFNNSLLNASFAYTGTGITWVYVGDFRTDLASGPLNGGYPRIAGLANYALGEEDYTSPDCGIFFYSPDASTWNALRAPDVYSLASVQNTAADPDSASRVILVMKQSTGGVWTQTAYYPDGTQTSGTFAGTVNHYHTDTLNLGGNREPNCAQFFIAHLAIYDHALSTADEAAAVAYLKSVHW